jgi:hypothetical protein
MMDANSIGTGVLSLTAPGTHFGEDVAARELARRVNNVHAELVKDRSDCFDIFVTTLLPDVDGALDAIAHADNDLDADGMVLVGNHHWSYGAWHTRGSRTPSGGDAVRPTALDVAAADVRSSEGRYVDDDPPTAVWLTSRDLGRGDRARAVGLVVAESVMGGRWGEVAYDNCLLRGRPAWSIRMPGGE